MAKEKAPEKKEKPGKGGKEDDKKPKKPRLAPRPRVWKDHKDKSNKRVGPTAQQASKKIQRSRRVKRWDRVYRVDPRHAGHYYNPFMAWKELRWFWKSVRLPTYRLDIEKLWSLRHLFSLTKGKNCFDAPMRPPKAVAKKSGVILPPKWTPKPKKEKPAGEAKKAKEAKPAAKPAAKTEAAKPSKEKPEGDKQVEKKDEKKKKQKAIPKGKKGIPKKHTKPGAKQSKERPEGDKKEEKKDKKKKKPKATPKGRKGIPKKHTPKRKNTCRAQKIALQRKKVKALLRANKPKPHRKQHRRGAVKCVRIARKAWKVGQYFLKFGPYATKRSVIKFFKDVKGITNAQKMVKFNWNKKINFDRSIHMARHVLNMRIRGLKNKAPPQVTFPGLNLKQLQNKPSYVKYINLMCHKPVAEVNRYLQAYIVLMVRDKGLSMPGLKERVQVFAKTAPKNTAPKNPQ